MKDNSSGQILIFSLIFVLIIVAFSGILISTVFVYSQHGKLAYAQEQALHLSEAGIDKAIYQISQTGGSSYTGETNTPLGNGVFTTTVSDVGSTKVIDSTGYVPDSSAPVAQKKVRIVLKTSTTGASFVYGVQVGFGGLVMSNNSTISGSVYSNGSIQGGNTASVITGDAYVAGGVSPTPDQQQILQTGQQNVGDLAAEIDAAQSFVPGINQVISRVSLYIEKVGNPSNGTVRIVTDNGGNPSQTTLASGTLDSGSVGLSFGWVDVSMATNPPLNAGQTYWLVLDLSQAPSSKYYVWGKHDNSGYGNGVGKYSDNWAANPSTWTDADGDMAFKIWMGSGNTQVSSVSAGGNVYANTINNSTVTKDAYYQTITDSTVVGTRHPGSADPPSLDMPLSRSVIEDFEKAAAAGGPITPSGGTYTVTGGDLGPVKVEGDLIFDGTVNITGPVWVTGDITVSTHSILSLDSSFGSESTMIIADNPTDPYSKGRIITGTNIQIEGTGDPSSFILMLSTYANLSTPAIDVRNNTDGAIFYSSNGIVSVNNLVDLKEVIGYSLSLAPNASVSYKVGLRNVHFSTGPSGGWAIKKGSWQIIP